MGQPQQKVGQPPRRFQLRRYQRRAYRFQPGVQVNRAEDARRYFAGRSKHSARARRQSECPEVGTDREDRGAAGSTLSAPLRRASGEKRSGKRRRAAPCSPSFW